MYKPNYQNIIILILTIIALIFVGIFIGKKKGQTEILGATCPTIVQALEAKCNCPDALYYSVGCTQQISGADKVEVKGATKIILDGKIYNTTDITNSTIKSTPAPVK